MLKRLYHRTMTLAAHPRAMRALIGVAFLESSVFPVPPDLLLIPMVLAARHKAFIYALYCTLASVIGGVFGYAIGFFLFEQVGRPILAFYGQEGNFQVFAETYNNWGAWAVLVAGITPFPFKVITILSGLTQLDLAVFVASSVIARGLRFFLVAGLLWWMGPPIRDFIENRLGLLLTLLMIGLIGGFALVRYLL